MAKVAKEHGIKKVITVVSDYGPGVDSETAFKTTFEAEGGAVVESIRMPLSTNDFSPIMQRVKDSGAEAVFAFLPSGPTTLGFVKAYNENGLKEAGIQLLAPGDLTQESDLPALGDAALGMLTTFHYAVSHDSPENKEFVEAAAQGDRQSGGTVFPSVGAYDGMHVIYKMIEATGGKQDAQRPSTRSRAWPGKARAARSRSTPKTPPHHAEHLSARGRQGGGRHLINKEIQTFEKQGDPGWHASKRSQHRRGRLGFRRVGSACRPSSASRSTRLAYGMVLFVISIGLSVTMGLMRVVNLAHGAFAMIGGYIASYATRDLGLGYGVAILLAVVGTIIIAIPLERLLYRRIYGAPELTQVLMTIGITFCIIGIANLSSARR